MNVQKQSTLDPQALQLFIACAPGLEPILLQELGELGIRGTAVAGGADCTTDLAGAYRALIGVGTGLRVLLRVAQFRAVRFQQLERGFQRIAWHQLLPPAALLDIRATTRRSRLYHSKAVAERLHTTLAQHPRLSLHPASAPGLQDDAPESNHDSQESRHDAAVPIRLQLRMDHDQCTVSLDLSGRPLNERGYRKASGKAPLREDLARALLRCAGYQPHELLLDPCCGVGTLPIEAALLAAGQPPGANRSFTLDELPFADPTLAAEARTALRALAPAGLQNPLILGSDRDAGAIRAAHANAQRAGMTDAIRFAHAPLSAVQLPTSAAGGLVVANPPYGLRMGDRQRLRDLYAALGSLRKRAPAGFRLALVTSNPQLARAVGLPLESLLLTDLGGTKVRFYVERPPGLQPAS